MYALLQDLRYGLRIMRKNPGFTAVVLVVLGLGIGGNTAIFSIVNGVLLEPLPYPRADQLVSIRSAEPSRGIPPVVASYADYLDWKQQAHAFSNMGTYVFDAFNLSAGEQPVHVEAVDATTSALQTLGIVPELGRIFSTNEEQWGNRYVVLITHALWRDKLISAGIRERLQQHAIYDAEDRRVTPNSQCKNDHHYRRETGTLVHDPETITEILQKRVHCPPLDRLRLAS